MVLWEYRGPNFLLAGEEPGQPRPGRYFDLLGFRIWIGEIEELLLKGRTLTIIHHGSPEPAELLVIQGAPEDHLETTLRAHCSSLHRSTR